MKYDLITIKEQSQTLKIEGNKLNASKNLNLIKQGLRRFENNKVFYASRIGEATTDRLITDSKEWGGPGVPHEFGFAPERKEKRDGPVIKKDLLQQFQETTIKLIERYPKFVFSGAATTTNLRKTLTSDYGLDFSTAGEYLEVVLSYQRKASGNMVDGFIDTRALNFDDIKQDLEQEEEFLRVHEKEIKLQNTRMPVLFVDSTEPIYKLIESFEVNRYNDGACVFAGKLGQKLFSNEVTLLDQAYFPSIGLNDFFDGDGVVRKTDPLALVENGIFKNLISDLRWAKKYGIESTGNGQRQYNRGVQLGLRSLRFAPGKHTWRETLKGLDRCIVAVLAAGGDSNELGEFSTPVQFGYVFEKGECIGRAPQVTVKTSVSNFLGKDLIAVSSDGFTKTKFSSSVISEMDVLVN
jgi:PmbA protein